MPSDRQRLLWVDVAKGWGIILVVLGHTERGLINAGLAPQGGWLESMDAWVYAFHMPLFFFFSGLFASRGAAAPWRKFLNSRARTIVYPYLVWATAMTAVQIVFSGSTNSPATMHDLASIPYDPPMQFWFLYILFLVVCLHKLLQTVTKSPLWVFAASLVLFASTPLMPALLARTANYLPYFAGAAFLAPHCHRLARMAQPLLIGLAAMAFVLLTFIYSQGSLRLLATVAGILGSVALSSAAARTQLGPVLAFLGRASLAIFVAHTLASAGFRIVLMKLGVEHLWLQLIGGIAAGLFFPIALEWAAEKLGFRHLFTLQHRLGAFPSTQLGSNCPRPNPTSSKP